MNATGKAIVNRQKSELQKLAKSARKRERSHLSNVRYYLRTRNYVEAAKAVAYALQASTLADQYDYLAKSIGALA